MIEQRKDSRGAPRYRARVTVFDLAIKKKHFYNGSWHRDKELARLEERELLHRRDHGELTATRGVTLDDYMSKEWLPSVEKVSHRGRPLGIRSAEKYRNHIGRLRPLIGHVPLRELKSVHVEHARDELGKTLAGDTVADTIGTLSRALDRAVIRGYIMRNPASPNVVTRPRSPKRKRSVISTADAKAILGKVAGTYPLDVGVHLALLMSLRREEVLGLRWSDVEMDVGTLTVRQAIIETVDGVVFGDPKSEASERELAIPDTALEALRRHRTEQLERRMRADSWTDLDLVVARDDGRPWMPSMFSKLWRRWATANDLILRFHDLRRGTAALMAAAGVSDAAALDVMGHADLRMLRHYQGIAADVRRETMRKIEQELHT